MSSDILEKKRKNIKNSQIFFERLALERAKHGATYKEIGTALGVRNTAVCNWEKKIREPGIDKLCALADFFGVSLDYLVGLTDDPTPPAKPTVERKIKKTGASD